MDTTEIVKAVASLDFARLSLLVLTVALGVISLALYVVALAIRKERK